MSRSKSQNPWILKIKFSWCITPDLNHKTLESLKQNFLMYNFRETLNFRELTQSSFLVRFWETLCWCLLWDFLGSNFGNYLPWSETRPLISLRWDILKENMVSLAITLRTTRKNVSCPQNPSILSEDSCPQGAYADIFKT